MTTMEKIKHINLGMALQKRASQQDRGVQRIYCGTEDYVEFFETVISTLGLDVKYRVEDVDGELEIVVF